MQTGTRILAGEENEIDVKNGSPANKSVQTRITITLLGRHNALEQSVISYYPHHRALPESLTPPLPTNRAEGRSSRLPPPSTQHPQTAKVTSLGSAGMLSCMEGDLSIKNPTLYQVSQGVTQLGAERKGDKAGNKPVQHLRTWKADPPKERRGYSKSRDPTACGVVGVGAMTTMKRSQAESLS